MKQKHDFYQSGNLFLYTRQIYGFICKISLVCPSLHIILILGNIWWFNGFNINVASLWIFKKGFHSTYLCIPSNLLWLQRILIQTCCLVKSFICILEYFWLYSAVNWQIGVLVFFLFFNLFNFFSGLKCTMCSVVLDVRNWCVSIGKHLGNTNGLCKSLSDFLHET